MAIKTSGATSDYGRGDKGHFAQALFRATERADGGNRCNALQLLIFDYFNAKAFDINIARIDLKSLEKISDDTWLYTPGRVHQ